MTTAISEPGEADAGSPPRTRAGFVSIVGRPNVGKSTLLNCVLGEKIAIVSPRPQTTRNRIMGVRTWGADQLVLLDTPGIHRGTGPLDRFMIREALTSLQGVDVIWLVTEVLPSRRPRPDPPAAHAAVELHPQDADVLEHTQRPREHAPVVVVLNKIDRVRDRRFLLPLMAAWRDRGLSCIVPISALQDDGVDELIRETLDRLPQAPHIYPEEMITDRAERWLAAELIREQVLLSCRQELPYATAVEVVRFEERDRKQDLVIEAVIHAERLSQLRILVGRAGQMIKRISTGARHEIGRLLGCPVHLKLTVHVEREWTRFASSRRRLGYE